MTLALAEAVKNIKTAAERIKIKQIKKRNSPKLKSFFFINTFQ